MASVDYVDIPPYATRLQSSAPSADVQPAPTITTSLPNPPDVSSSARASAVASAIPPPNSAAAAAAFSLPSVLLSSLPSGPQSNPRDAGNLLSTRDPLSIPITTANFRRFVFKIGPVFWLQDRVEEIIMWRRGWRVTCVWMSAYAFLCYFPRLVLLLPLVVLISVLLATHPTALHSESDIPPVPTTQPGEGSADWQANIQGIQNLMGAVSDAHDLLIPLLPHLTHQTPYSKPLLALLTTTLLLSIPLVHTLPIRPTILALGLAPILALHPLVRTHILPRLLSDPAMQQYQRRLRARALQAADDSRLADKHWRAEIRAVELFENERFTADAGWAKTNLRHGERVSWTRARDGASPVDGSADVSNLTFGLAPGWAFVETEDWRPDIEGSWIECRSDDSGWVYSDDVWLNPRPVPAEEWATNGMTRRRRWVRRIYYAGGA